MHQNTDIQNELETISPFWQTLHATMPYQVPAQYFEELHGIVRASIEKEAVYAELASIAPLLNTIPKTNVYQHPEAVPQKSLPLFRFVKWAVAAVIIGVMAISAFLYNNKVEQFDYAAYSTMDHNQLLQTMSDSTLLSYIDAHETLITTPDISIPEYDLGTSTSLIEQSSDQALVEYIESSN